MKEQLNQIQNNESLLSEKEALEFASMMRLVLLKDLGWKEMKNPGTEEYEKAFSIINQLKEAVDDESKFIAIIKGISRRTYIILLASFNAILLAAVGGGSQQDMIAYSEMLEKAKKVLPTDRAKIKEIRKEAKEYEL